MATRLNLPSSCNQENVIWSWPSIVDTTSIIWICVSDELQLTRFHVVFYRYRITFLIVFHWSILGFIKYLPSFLMVYAMFGQVQTWTYINFQPPMHMECLSFSLFVCHSWDIRVDSTYFPESNSSCHIYLTPYRCRLFVTNLIFHMSCHIESGCLSQKKCLQDLSSQNSLRESFWSQVKMSYHYLLVECNSHYLLVEYHPRIAQEI